MVYAGESRKEKLECYKMTKPVHISPCCSGYSRRVVSVLVATTLIDLISCVLHLRLPVKSWLRILAQLSVVSRCLNHVEVARPFLPGF
jgi:hypothetical protein